LDERRHLVNAAASNNVTGMRNAPSVAKPALGLAIVVWLALCVVADINEPGVDTGELVAGAAVRAAVTLVIALFVRWLYLRNHNGRAFAAETFWIAALLAALLAALRLTS
jgi:hypothetical protein